VRSSLGLSAIPHVKEPPVGEPKDGQSQGEDANVAGSKRQTSLFGSQDGENQRAACNYEGDRGGYTPDALKFPRFVIAEIWPVLWHERRQ
jgi:hypothetical protein